MRILGLALLVAVFFGSAQAAQSGVTIPNRLLYVEKGEWVLYLSQENHSRKETVVDIEEKNGDRMITVLHELLIDEQVVQQREEVFSLNGVLREQEEMWSEDRPELSLSQGLEQFNGEDIEVVVVQYAGPDGVVVRSFLSDRIPVTGILKVEVAGDLYMEVSDFGY